MCLYPRLMENPKYKPNKKNGGKVPPVFDNRTRTVAIGCGTCLECRKQKAREWTARLQEDIKDYPNGKFVTLTFSTEALRQLAKPQLSIMRTKRYKFAKPPYKQQRYKRKNKYIDTTNLKGYDLDNAIATRAVRLFLERWRKKHKKSLRHWLITELGGGHSEHVHLHGIVWTDYPELIDQYWQYGYVWKGYEKNGKIENYVNARTINYIVKYVSKMDEKHLNYKPVILTSSGIGAGYINKGRCLENKWNGNDTNEYYRTSSGHKIALPIYYRNKLYNEHEREQLWIWKLDEEVRYVLGQKISIKLEEDTYYKVLLKAQETTHRLGYPRPEFIWNKRKYEEDRRKKIHENRLKILDNNNKKTADSQTAYGIQP